MNKLIRIILTGMIVFIHTGWILPIYLGISLLYSWFYCDVMPIIWKTPRIGTVFPTFYSAQLLKIGFIWLTLLAAFWSIQLSRRLFFKKKQPPLAK